MAFINLKHKLIQVKIIYYGPGRGGKTTNLEYIHRIQRPYFPASALKGTNVVATLKKIITLTIASIRKELH